MFDWIWKLVYQPIGTAMSLIITVQCLTRFVRNRLDSTVWQNKCESLIAVLDAEEMLSLQW